jgi:hypothetical protein
LRAWLVFIDESGLLMAPLVRRTWAPRGRTPLLYQRTRSHQKVTIIGALCVAPERDRVHLYFRLPCIANINARRTADFLAHLDRQLHEPLILIWDRLQAHRVRLVKTFLAAHKHIRSVFLPPYAPELNPIVGERPRHGRWRPHSAHAIPCSFPAESPGATEVLYPTQPPFVASEIGH